MKLQTKINIYSLGILIALTFSIIIVGTVVITDIVYRLNHNRLTIETGHLLDIISENYGILERVGIDDFPHYVERMHKKLLDGFKDYRFGKTGVLVIYAENGAKQLFSSDSARWPPLSGFNLENELVLFSFGNQERYGVIKRFEPWDWTLLLSITRSEMFEKRTQYLIKVSLMGFAILLVNIAVWTRIVSRLSVRIDQTLACADQVTEGDLSARIDPILIDDEIGRLQEKINFMIASIETRTLESQKSRQALKESRNKYLSYIENAPDSVFIIDGSGYLIELNKAFVRMIGYEKAVLLQMSISDLAFESDRGAVDNLFSELPCSGRLNAEIRLRRLDNEECFWIVEGVRLADDRYLCFAKDITDRKKMEFQLKHAGKMEALGTLAGGISHDFNNLLGFIMGNIEMSGKEIPESHPVHEKLVQSFQACLRAKDVLGKILSFARKKEEGQQRLQITPLVKVAVGLIRSTIPAHIEVKTHFSARSDWVLADASDIDRMVVNLCTNAIHAMKPGGGVLTVSLANITAGTDTDALYSDLAPGDYLLLTVEDTGCGISQSIIDKLFDPYFTTKPAGEGTGMGLAMVHGIVSGAGGNIFVTSEEGEGACFKIVLPLANPSASEIKDAAGDAGDLNTLAGDEKLLFIDDELPSLKLGKEMLNQLGYQVDEYADPFEALEWFSEKYAEFDLIITDMNMPRMDGDELVRKLHQIRPDIPVILCTGYGDVMTDEDALQSDIRTVLTKPYTLFDIGRTVREVLDEDISGE